MRIKEDAQKWVAGFDGIQLGIIQNLMIFDPEDWKEVTYPVVGDQVYVYKEDRIGEIVHKSSVNYKIELDGNREVWSAFGGFKVIRCGNELPIWGTMWSFRNSMDKHWLERENGVEVLTDCGFRVFESAKFGMFFGIDGAGYDFYEAHWIPLYKARRFLN